MLRLGVDPRASPRPSSPTSSASVREAARAPAATRSGPLRPAVAALRGLARTADRDRDADVTRPAPAGWSRSGAPPAPRAARRSPSASPPRRPREASRSLLLDADPYGGAVAQHLAVLDDASGLLAAARLANAGHARRRPAGGPGPPGRRPASGW